MRLFLFLLLVSSSLLAQRIKLPKEPTPPTEPGADVRGDSNSNGSENSSSNSKSEAESKVKVYLCDGRTVTGTWKDAPKEFSFKHKKEDVVYSKTLKYSEISKIQIKAWKMQKGKPTKKGIPYKVEPWDAQFRTKTNELFEISGDIKKDLLLIRVQNEQGEATLYSYWMDLLYENKSWFSKLPPIEGEIRKECYPDVVIGVEFLS
ncbi:hypothetical protein CH373_13345 [Leptospira perolatii]|uniref:Uncharacterized protein n=1 Tax=Leptospira perolatii TaxID=2023191 RepID=A0A2M9ZKY5_9LEPT|nr:hypothetical protein CH360_08340 [Leptospira perolatii]PJZ72740.1 hypothetical protein CH373_13345 [Leptospira perolatii]